MRVKSAIKDGDELIPAIYKTMTDDEAYEMFKDIYSEEVKQAMVDHCNEDRANLNQRKDSAMKQKRLEQLDKKECRFPSLSWFIQQKPKETKFMSDHCTGLCKDCEQPQLNLESLVKYMKKLCRCRTKLCPRWYCSCNLDEHGEVKETCDCGGCDCDECMKCEVSVYILTCSFKM